MLLLATAGEYLDAAIAAARLPVRKANPDVKTRNHKEGRPGGPPYRFFW
jgi:hypothetical protein